MTPFLFALFLLLTAVAGRWAIELRRMIRLLEKEDPATHDRLFPRSRLGFRQSGPGLLAFVFRDFQHHPSERVRRLGASLRLWTTLWLACTALWIVAAFVLLGTQGPPAP